MSLKRKRGLTLIEVIVSIAIIGIMAVGFLTVFASGFKGIVGAGERSHAGFKAQSNVEEALRVKPLMNAAGNTKLPITFSDASRVEVEGRIERQSSIINNKQVVIFVFNPVN